MTYVRLVVRQGPQAGQAIEVQQPSLSIGRSRENDWQIDDPQISRHHARLTQTAGFYTLEDLGSTNGTFVNTQRLTTPVQIAPGDVIGLGNSILIDVQAFAGGAPPTQPTPQNLLVEPPYARAYTPPPPPPPVTLKPDPRQRLVRNLAIGCGILLGVVLCGLAAAVLVYLFAPPDLAAPICQALRPLPVVGGFCP